MADVIVVGAGVGGVSAAMLLAGDGHQVTVLERDPAPPPVDPQDSWVAWQMTPDEVFSPGFADKVVAAGAGWRDERLPGPTRDELLSIVSA